MAAQRVATVAALYRFPVKSMAGESLDAASMYWHGIEGDRRQVFVKTGDLSSFPWLTARDVPDLVRYAAALADPSKPRTSSARVRTPDGDDLDVESEQLRADLEARHGAPIHLMRISRGAPDVAAVSVIGLGTLRALGERIGLPLDVRRFRQNIYLETDGGAPDVEDAWVGRLLVFGEGNGAGAGAPSVRILRPDSRCMIVNLDPETARHTPAVLREIAQSRGNRAGLYCSVETIGPLKVGDPVYLV
jgi:uncharacterized protein YcbX